MSVASNEIGHWLLFYKRNSCLYFFDSFALNPIAYGGAISKLFYNFPLHKIHGISDQVQSDSSYVCGAYCIFFANLMSNAYAIHRINSIFSKNTEKNDLIVTNFLYNMIGIKISCSKHFCPSIVFNSRCRKFCCCT